ncbi:MAG: signal peptide peptidase SppA [Acidimicrobiia bacterium]
MTRRLPQALFLALVLIGLASAFAATVAFFRRPFPALALAAVVVMVGAVAAALRRRVPARTYIELDLDRPMVEQLPDELLGRTINSQALVLRDVVDALDRAATDRRVAGLVARVGNGRLGVAQAQELRNAVRRFAEAGKRTVAFAETFGEGRLALVPYYLATAFEEVCLQPTGEVNIQGVVARRPFLRRLLDRLQVTPAFDHRKEYKAALYLLTEDRYPEADREATTALLETHLDQLVAGVAEARRLTPARVRELIDRAPLSPEEAMEAGLVDRLGYRDEAYPDRLLYAARYLARAGRPHRRGAKVALIYGVGPISRGSSRFDLLTQGSSMGSDEVAGAFRAATSDRKVRAIIFRIDSPGGSAVASDVIWREIHRAREAGKPVVATMSDVAASGGYWAATACARIVAQPGTITGSIGVVAGKLVTRRAWGRLGVSWDELHLGENATFHTPDYDWSETERARLDAYLDRVYDDFVGRVAEARSMRPEQVEEVARGRVWSGRDAHRLGLVDDLGGMETALRLAREAAGMDDSVKIVPYPRPRRLPRPRKPNSSQAAALEGTRPVRMPGWP